MYGIVGGHANQRGTRHWVLAAVPGPDGDIGWELFQAPVGALHAAGVQHERSIAS